MTRLRPVSKEESERRRRAAVYLHESRLRKQQRAMDLRHLVIALIAIGLAAGVLIVEVF